MTTTTSPVADAPASFNALSAPDQLALVERMARVLRLMPCACTTAWNHNELKVTHQCPRCRVLTECDALGIAPPMDPPSPGM